jgi:hypothetical protein
MNPNWLGGAGEGPLGEIHAALWLRRIVQMGDSSP